MKFQNTFLVNFPNSSLISEFGLKTPNFLENLQFHKESILKFHNRDENKNSNHRIWKFKDFVLTVHTYDIKS